MGIITASNGDSVTSIAHDKGFFWETIWNHSENSDLKNKRKDPNIILPGDEVFVPDLETKKENRPNEARHKFKRKGVPATLKLRLTRLDKPRANEPYTLIIDGELFTGQTDGDGQLEHPIPPNARSAILKLQEGKEEYPITIGGLDPFDSPTGVQQRLNNLGFAPGDISGDLEDPDTVEAIKNFQKKYDLDVTGIADDATKQKIEDVHV